MNSVIDLNLHIQDGHTMLTRAIGNSNLSLASKCLNFGAIIERDMLVRIVGLEPGDLNDSYFPSETKMDNKSSLDSFHENVY